ncbi:hypothetical protein BCV69DRAFT_300663 [Microstroma glucosiphilum]|uniref:Uncharacterized protein n=1 Tax=Pseudomicrostroma glucosiphilum TaxID=1684307 RepID=A0A316U3H4_9BASI|nr:hypothetical protein BCV69DRAFT_300663 [Pseudomicrostroma glucosiphilum]PWN19344.1 hypothetical protein BCV69DRAFT_300663 [Pseudomicrostroma glucosiphilum]
MSHSTSPKADTSLPNPRVSSLVYRCSSHQRESSSNSPPQPLAQNTIITSRFTALNGVEDDYCWITDTGLPEGVHVVPHAESDCTRLILWLQTMEIVPRTIQSRTTWKVSHENQLPLAHSIYRHLTTTDGERRRALLRPTRGDLVLLVRVLEEGLQREEEREHSTSAWRPHWGDIVEAGWPRKESFGTFSLPSHEYQLDIFDLKRRTILTYKGSAEPQAATRVTGDERYPITLKHPLDSIRAPLNVLSVVAVAVSQMRYISRAPGRIYRADFMDDLDIMSYIINLLGCPTPTYFRRLQRPSVLPPLPDSASPASSERIREWPSRARTRSSAAAPGVPQFSSSTPEGYKENLDPALYGMERVQIVEQEASVSTEAGHDDSERDGGPGSPKSRGTEAEGEEGRSNGGHYSHSTSDLSSISMHTSSELQDAKDAMTVSSVEEPPPEELRSSVEAGDCYEPRPLSVAHWHEESRALDDRQDELFESAASALAQRLQACSSHVASATVASATTPLFDFLVSTEPLDITPMLQSIDERREELLEQWEDGLKWMET